MLVSELLSGEARMQYPSGHLKVVLTEGNGTEVVDESSDDVLVFESGCMPSEQAELLVAANANYVKFVAALAKINDLVNQPSLSNGSSLMASEIRDILRHEILGEAIDE